ncbi:MAG: sigma-70 family RNA polymerase sigma factor [Planctomycetes bacterium]|nr:sigma-70 family RNA polymerase sigma factor [Planctomycetota bacterium]
MRDSNVQPHHDERLELLRRWQEQGEEEALDGLLRLEMPELKSRLRGKGRTIVTSPGSVSDVAQEAVLRILQVGELPRFASPKAFSAYLWRTAWRLLLDRLRLRRAPPVSIDSGSSERVIRALEKSRGESPAERDEAQTQIAFVLTLMPPPDRRILELRYFREMSFRQIGVELGLDPDTARGRLSRAKLRLAKKLKEWRQILS